MKLKLFALLALVFAQPTFAANDELLDFQNDLFQLPPTSKSLRWAYDTTYSPYYDSDVKATLASYLLEYGNHADRERAKIVSLDCIYGDTTTMATLIAAEILCAIGGDYKEMALNVASSIMQVAPDLSVELKAMDILLRYGREEYWLAVFKQVNELFSFRDPYVSLSAAEILLKYGPSPLALDHLNLIHDNDAIDSYFRQWAESIWSETCVAWGDSLFNSTYD